ncbi:UDP-N-acetylmuramoyl-tripeptide--D-alanyl-D-alanine ligase [Quadrisphaera sp. DSM 44207]|uniref:UDP-N-acetylmuramoyl-tripeptide--D-alanyl-D- alanine ligase n=1 Tax=Quadrisphaera sp. DSM 44207 TaxID=1881057 RepID=UPI00088A7275|nr:UDP-N-acetylmuramoyl-tripeptide--D-alanyl-D-alanine ligase [Quadrisphaera sp. DSM 44207]SDQ53675.1 UDP-N-acetylmuramoyl-tripeptide--D-alanyl-D-alanine ligase [Quadrisphaera sp. DSM 44207]
MIPIALGDVAAATGGRLAGGADAEALVTSVVPDSRAAAPQALFVAVPGEHVDGHDYALPAIGAGAVAVLAEREVGVPAVVVPGAVRDALAALAREVLARRRALAASTAGPFDVVAVTGSSGKTSTKDLLAAVLGTAGPTVAPPGSFNNELGVPLTALTVAEDTRFLVVEMGARGVGHIAALCATTAPRVGAVLNVGSAHLGEFGGVEAIARAKGELVEALPAAADGGVAVLNADDARVAAMAQRTRAAVLRFGAGGQGDVRAQDVRLDALGRASFTLLAPDGSAPVALRLHGEHHVANALAAAAVAHAVGLPVAQVAQALGAAGAASRHRMEVTERPDGVTVVNDAYNANPESVRAALRALVAMGGRGRTWAVLGEMLELGDAATAEHDAVGRLAVRLDVSRLVAVGAGARAVYTGALLEGSFGDEAAWVPDADAAEALLAAELRPGDVVLVKSSHGAGLRHLGDRLAAAGASA